MFTLVTPGWQASLSDCFALFADKGYRDSADITLQIGADTLQVMQQNRPLLERPIPLSNPLQPESLLATVISRCHADGVKPATVNLQFSQVVSRTLTLPRALLVNLRQSLIFEMDRYTPFSAEAICFDYVVADHPQQSDKILVTLSYLPLRLLTPWQEALATLSLQLLLVSGEQRAGAMNLLPLAQRQQRPPLLGRTRQLSLLLLLLLIAALLITPLLQQRLEVTALGEIYNRTLSEANRVQDLRQRYESDSFRLGYLQGLQQAAPLRIELLRELTQLIPDHTTVQQLRMMGRQIEVIGVSAAASELIALLEASPLFNKVEFVSALSRVGREQQEQFHLRLELETPPVAEASR
ncbi:MAG: PilN domain-containing protein [Gammaproteobacteria bacterium]|nr:PilN domain-containing protein [Gammaproteobacteria bacterium]